MKSKSVLSLVLVSGVIKKICYNIFVNVNEFATAMSLAWKKTKDFTFHNVAHKLMPSWVICKSKNQQTQRMVKLAYKI